MQNIPSQQLDRIVFVIFAVLALSLISATIDKITTNYQLQGQIELLANEVEVLELENQNLKFRLDYYRSDEYVELALKERSNLVSPNEKVIYLQKDIRPDLSEQQEVEQSAPDQDKSNIIRWLEFFRGV